MDTESSPRSTLLSWYAFLASSSQLPLPDSRSEGVLSSSVTSRSVTCLQHGHLFLGHLVQPSVFLVRAMAAMPGRQMAGPMASSGMSPRVSPLMPDTVNMKPNTRKTLTRATTRPVRGLMSSGLMVRTILPARKGPLPFTEAAPRGRGWMLPGKWLKFPGR